MSWGEMNEYVLLRIYSLLSTGDLASAGKVCMRWRGISRWAHAHASLNIIQYSDLCRDELLWKRIVVRSCYGEAAAWGEVSLCPGTTSWFREAEDARRGPGRYLSLYILLKFCTHLTARIPPPLVSTGG